MENERCESWGQSRIQIQSGLAARVFEVSRDCAAKMGGIPIRHLSILCGSAMEIFPYKTGQRGFSKPADQRNQITTVVHAPECIDSDNLRRRHWHADGQRPHPVAAHRERPGAASRTSSRPTHLCAGITADVQDWWGGGWVCAAHSESPHLVRPPSASVAMKASLAEAPRFDSGTPPLSLLLVAATDRWAAV